MMSSVLSRGNGRLGSSKKKKYNISALTIVHFCFVLVVL